MALVLLVDDTRPTLTVAQHYFLKNGFEVMTAGNGIQALEKVEERRPAVIVSDLDMPGMNGIDLLFRLKGNPDTCGIPVVTWSSDTSDTTIAECLGAGAELHHPRPIDAAGYRDFIALVRRLAEPVAAG